MKKRNNILLIAYVLLLISACTVNSIDSEKMSYEEHISKAREYGKAHKLDEAINELKMAVQLKPATEEAHFDLALAYYSKWKITFDEAQSRHIDEMFLNPSQYKKIVDSLNDQDKLNAYYGEKREFKQLAMKEFQEALKYNPNNWVALYHIATDHLNNGFYDEAIKEYEQIIKIKPDYVNSYGLMADAYYKKGLYELAIAKYKEALALDPKRDNYHYEMAKAYLKLNKKKEALKELEVLKKLDSIFYERLREKIGEKEK